MLGTAQKNRHDFLTSNAGGVVRERARRHQLQTEVLTDTKQYTDLPNYRLGGAVYWKRDVIYRGSNGVR